MRDDLAANSPFVRSGSCPVLRQSSRSDSDPERSFTTDAALGPQLEQDPRLQQPPRLEQNSWDQQAPSPQPIELRVPTYGPAVAVENGYHALAIDEHRAAFKPTLWTKKFKDGVTPGEMAPPRAVAHVEQRWFVGAHANVGGGYRDDLLSQLPLHWIMEKAAGHGLAFRADVVLEPGVLELRPRDSYGDFAKGLYRYVAQPFYRLIGAPPEVSGSERDETVNETIDASVFERWRADRTYRPQNLTDWARRFGVTPGALTDAVFAHDPQTVVPVTTKDATDAPFA